ncbi:hypothetical protein BJV78DRAFT_1352372 [Lactifluus subvellereus]|nr:hypothetical protein BJV78DRAFT_1352372 [Lactifluus subvellereus]
MNGGLKIGKGTHRDSHDPLVVDQHLVIPVPLLTRRLTPPSIGPGPMADPSSSESTTLELLVEVVDDDGASIAYLNQEREQHAASAARPTGTRPTLALYVPGVLLIARGKRRTCIASSAVPRRGRTDAIKAPMTCQNLRVNRSAIAFGSLAIWKQCERVRESHGPTIWTPRNSPMTNDSQIASYGGKSDWEEEAYMRHQGRVARAVIPKYAVLQGRAHAWDPVCGGGVPGYGRAN